MRTSVARAVRLLLGGLVALAAVGGCGPAHTGAYKQKKRDYASDTKADKKTPPLSEGSLWQDGRPASMLFTDARALH